MAFYFWNLRCEMARAFIYRLFHNNRSGNLGRGILSYARFRFIRGRAAHIAAGPALQKRGTAKTRHCNKKALPNGARMRIIRITICFLIRI